MNKKRKLAILFLSSILLFLYPQFNSSLVRAETELEVMTKNPYILAYLVSDENNVDTLTDDFLVDPEVEERIILETLEEYFELDQKVSDLLITHYPDLVTSDMVISTNREDKIKVMETIIQIFNSINDRKNEELLLGYLDRYALGPNDSNEKVLDFIQIHSITVPSYETQATYNNVGAANWAFNNYNSYRRDFPKFTGNFGTNCTDFVSQAVHIGGGIRQQRTWFVERKNTTYWTINSASQLDYSWRLSDPSPWISVREFRDFWGARSSIRSHSKAYYTSNHKTLYNQHRRLGDIVVFRKGVANFATVPTHLMIVSRFDSTNKDLKLAGQTQNRRDLALLSAVKNYQQIEFLRIK